jgi:hypothetical protein
MESFTKMRRSVIASIFVLSAWVARAQLNPLTQPAPTPPSAPTPSAPLDAASAAMPGTDAPPPPAPVLVGTIDGDDYVSPTGTFKVRIPVLPSLGGTITDTANVVTFQDGFNTHISIAAFKQDATQRWQYSFLGIKDYLQYFLSNFVLPDFARAFPKVQLDTSGVYIKNFDGALIAFILLPGGSMFASRIPHVAEDAKPPVAKRGNMLFVKNGTIFVISTELAERVTEGSSYNKTSKEENDLLKERLVDIGNRMRFLTPPKP